MAEQKILQTTLAIVEAVYKNTGYDDKQDAEQVFTQLRTDLTTTITMTEGRKIAQKFTVLARTVTTEGSFNDMVKVIWRMVKTMTGSPLYRLGLLFIAVGSMCDNLLSSPNNASVAKWMEMFEKWLGQQLTIGGKGVAGEGEGSVADRIQKFFSTPYLHDYD